tara:strand:+ start:1121 stop:2056 length:936 start_codon:yes stop_codon:yes gene_type:complete
MMPADQVQADGEMRAEEEEISKSCHIYLICKRPATYFVNDTLVYKDNNLSVTVGYKINGEEHRFQYDGEFPLLDGAVRLAISDYPYREILTYDSDDNEVRRLPASLVSVKQNSSSPLKKLEVLYIGQSFGNGSRSAHQRLKSHSTLQKILADSAHKYPDSEVSVLMFKFEPYRLLMSFDGISKDTITGKKDKERFISIQENPLSLKQQVGLVEASLIRYFQPKYNDKFKLIFPSPKVKLLKECFKLDFSGLVIEINSEELRFELFSPTRESKMHHISNIDIVSDKSRASFFYITGRSGETVKFNDVIEPSA